jgi:putative transcription antitermination factor YqgF
MGDIASVNYLGIDWGATDVGVAIAHAETRIAMAYTTLHNDAGLLDCLGDIIVREHIGTVVIGTPLYIGKSAVEHPGKQLGESLAGRFSVHIAYQNEMFTTKMAQAHLIERGMRQVSKHDDAEAARIILEEWLTVSCGSR